MVLKKGYGFAGPGRPVDPDRTLFRVGSISKTFTWIAAMKEVEAGRMRLDEPINEYLPADLAIPTVPGWRPVELRDLMSHTPGFEERILDHMFVETSAQIRPPGRRTQALPTEARVSARDNSRLFQLWHDAHGRGSLPLGRRKFSRRGRAGDHRAARHGSHHLPRAIPTTR